MPRIEPDRAALEIAHSLLHCTETLDAMLAKRPFELILKNVAVLHMQRRERMDVKKLQANDYD